MKTSTRGAVTPQRKIIAVSKKFGNPGIKKQQGTTKVIFDMLPVDGRRDFRFFEEASSRTFPETNVASEGNRLSVGNVLAVERAYITIMEKSIVAPFPFVTIQDIEASGWIEGRLGLLNTEIANVTVAKDIPILSFEPQFNKNGCSAVYNNFECDTQVVIQPLLEFVFTLRVPQYVELADTFIILTIEGVGSFISPRATQ